MGYTIVFPIAERQGADANDAFSWKSFRQKRLVATFSLSRTSKAKFTSTLPRQEKVHEMKPHVKRTQMGCTGVQPICGLDRGEANDRFSRKKFGGLNFYPYIYNEI
ncbi:MAG: hypothetical protein J6K38_01485 [Alistipes sp.]|nr:hypothetical protein [Alistipes sp.]